MIETPNGTKIKKCPHGYGLFATKNFRKGQLISNISGGKIVKNSSDASMFALKIPSKKMWWDEINPAKPEWDSFIDHNKEPNAEILFKKFNPKKPEAKLIAIANIKINDEIAINYWKYGDRLYKSKRYKTSFVKP